MLRPKGFAASGAREVIWVYQKIRETKPSYYNEGVEEMITAQKDGRLGELFVEPTNSKAPKP